MTTIIRTTDAISAPITMGYACQPPNGMQAEKQVETLLENGCDVVFMEEPTTGKMPRKELERALKYCIRSGDTFMVCKLDCMARSPKHLQQIAQHLADRDVRFISLDDKLDVEPDMLPMLASLAAMGGADNG